MALSQVGGAEDYVLNSRFARQLRSHPRVRADALIGEERQEARHRRERKTTTQLAAPEDSTQKETSPLCIHTLCQGTIIGMLNPTFLIYD